MFELCAECVPCCAKPSPHRHLSRLKDVYKVGHAILLLTTPDVLLLLLLLLLLVPVYCPCSLSQLLRHLHTRLLSHHNRVARQCRGQPVPPAHPE
jgi:hypothetical protein